MNICSSATPSALKQQAYERFNVVIKFSAKLDLPCAKLIPTKRSHPTLLTCAMFKHELHIILQSNTKSNKMEYLSSYTIYNEMIDGMDAMGIDMEELAENLHMTQEELEEILTPSRDFTISEIKNLLGALYLDIKVEVVPD